jgi:RNA polymerase sigma-70 factor (ECF subfamily)
MSDTSIRLLARWQRGDEEAAQNLFDRYAERLLALAHSRLPPGMAARVDSEDVIQSVYRSFFAAAREGRYVLQQSGDLWRLLVTITLNKTARQRRRHLAASRSVARDCPLAPEESEGDWQALVSREPSPDAVLALTDLLENALQPFSEPHRRLIGLYLQGYPVAEIASTVGVSQRTVFRVLEQFKEDLTPLIEPEALRTPQDTAGQ